jgi:hypothetical protein
MPNCLRFVAIACLFVFGLAAADSRGVVKFAGLPLPGAMVTASQGDKQVTAVTDEQGAYTLPDLTDGVWSTKVEMLCFATVTRDIAVSADSPAAEWEMKMLSFDEIKATAPPPAPSSGPAASTTAAAGQPAAGQPAAAGAPAANPSLVAAQQQVAAQAAAANAKGKGKGKAATPAAAQTGFQRADVSASGNAPPPPADAGAGSMGADASSSGASEAMVVNGSTSNGVERRSFGNGRRGPASMFNFNVMTSEYNSALNAKNYSVTGLDSPKPAQNTAVFGGSVGGPLWIPHLLRPNGGNFFVNYQGTRARSATTNPTTMPTLADRTGDFSQAVNSLGQPVTIYDPASGAPFPNAQIPQTRFSPQALALLKLYPTPNFVSTSLYNYQIPTVGQTDYDNFQVRLSRMLNTKNFVNGLIGYSRTRSQNESQFLFVDHTESTGIHTNEAWRHIFSRQFTGVLTFDYSRLAQTTTPNFANKENIAGEAGILGDDQTPLNWGPPSLGFSGGSGIAGLGDGNESLVRNQTIIVTPQFLWFRRPHNYSFQFDYKRQQFNNVGESNARGGFGFTGQATGLFNNGVFVPGTGYDFADFLLGVPDTASIAYGNADKYFRSTLWDASFNDDFRVTSTLSLQYGVRWDYYSPVIEKYGRLVNLDVTQGWANSAPVTGLDPVGSLTSQSYPTSLLKPDKHLFQPRVGIAWHPFLGSSLLIRAGYGLNANTSVYQGIAQYMSQQSPFSKSFSIPNNLTNPFTLANAFNATPTGSTTNTFAVDPNYLVGYVQTWTVSMQEDLPASLVGTLIYLGNKGTRSAQVFDPNTYPNGAVNPCPTCLPGYSYLTSNGNSHRESATLQLRRRFHNGIAAQGQYIYSKSIDDSAGLGGAGGTRAAQNWLNLSGERSLSGFDQRHNLQLTTQYSTGVGVHGGGLMSGWRGAMFKGWTFITNLNVGTGLPLTPSYSLTVAGVSTNLYRPLYTGQPIYDAPEGRFLNPDAFIAPLAGEWGNTGRNTITGPYQFGFSANMARTFATKLDVTINSTNILNHVVINGWNTVVNNAQFGLPTSANAMRTLQLQLRWRF